MLEKELEKIFCKMVKLAGGRAYKFTSPGNAGVPDRLVVMPNGVVAFAELKQKGKEPRPSQLMQIDRLRNLGCYVAVVDSEDKISEFMTEVCRRAKV